MDLNPGPLSLKENVIPTRLQICTICSKPWPKRLLVSKYKSNNNMSMELTYFPILHFVQIVKLSGKFQKI